MSSHAISADGLALIQQFEGFRSEPAQLPDGNWIVGHGHVRIGEAGAPVSRAEAEELLALDLAPIERAVNTQVIVAITQQQFDALVSFTLSVGVEAFGKSAVLRRINTGALIAASCALEAYRKSDVGGELVVVDALVRRRAAEKALLLADLPVIASPSAFMRAQLDHAAAILGAPVDVANAPEVGSVPVRAPKPAPAQRLTEILKSEPATETLLLTQVANDIDIANDEDEIVTAHAKPVARALDHARRAANRAAEEAKAEKKSGFGKILAWPKLPSFKFNAVRSVENAGLIALLTFGVGLVGLGALSLLGGNVDGVDIAGASALGAPGAAAATLAGYGLIKTPA